MRDGTGHGQAADLWGCVLDFIQPGNGRTGRPSQCRESFRGIEAIGRLPRQISAARLVMGRSRERRWDSVDCIQSGTLRPGQIPK